LPVDKSEREAVSKVCPELFRKVECQAGSSRPVTVKVADGGIEPRLYYQVGADGYAE
jgi:hypothetical protein